VQITDYRCIHVSEKSRVGTGQYYIWIEGFTTYRKRIGINIIPVTVSHEPIIPVSRDGMRNLHEHQLTSVCLVVPFWLAMKYELELIIL
jgi:hypothetical protein